MTSGETATRPAVKVRTPGDVAVTPTQRATTYFFLVVALLFVIQVFVGAASEHYRADLSSFFGFDLARWLPYNLVRTWHVQLSIFWTATSFLATGLFLAPMISGREPRRQSAMAYGLLGALAVVVFGSMIGELLDIHGWLSPALHVFGMQGWEYLDLGRVWQVLFNSPSKRGPKHAPDLRRVVDAMLYVSHTGCQWRFLPEPDCVERGDGQTG